MASITAGTAVEILIAGVWEGPFTVEAGAGRTADHLILSGRSGRFEHYYDGIYNTRVIDVNIYEGFNSGDTCSSCGEACNIEESVWCHCGFRLDNS